MASAYVGSTFIPPLFGLLGNAVSFSILPVYLLGGVGVGDTERAWQLGAQGVAGIRAFWPSL